jgi:UDP-N-acetyl-D-galactosamine dehydrogenase
VVDIVYELKTYGIKVLVHDPFADAEETVNHYGIELAGMENLEGVDAVIITVGHKFYKKLGFSRIAGLCQGKAPVVIDVKGVFSHNETEKTNITYWSL